MTTHNKKQIADELEGLVGAFEVDFTSSPPRIRVTKDIGSIATLDELFRNAAAALIEADDFWERLASHNVSGGTHPLKDGRAIEWSVCESPEAALRRALCRDDTGTLERDLRKPFVVFDAERRPEARSP